MKLRVAMAAGILTLAMVTASLAQGGGRRGFGGMGGMGGLLMITEVQKEIKVDEAQSDLLKQLGQEMGGKAREQFRDFQNLSQDERTKRFQAFQAEYDKKIGEILDAKQVARLKQLDIQRAGTRALSRKDVQDELKLTVDQRTKIDAVMAGEREAMRQAFEGFRNGGQMTQEQRDQARAKFDMARKDTDAKLLGALTEPQKKQFTTMQGAPFKFPERQFGGRPPRTNQ